MDVKAEGLDVYNTMLAALDVNDRLGPKNRQMSAVEAIRV